MGFPYAAWDAYLKNAWLCYYQLQNTTVTCQHGVHDKPSLLLCELTSHRNQILNLRVRVRGQQSRGEAACALHPWPRLTSDLWSHPSATRHHCVPAGDRQDVLCQQGHSSFLPLSLKVCKQHCPLSVFLLIFTKIALKTIVGAGVFNSFISKMIWKQCNSLRDDTFSISLQCCLF